MIYEIDLNTHNEFNTVAGFLVGWIDNDKYFINDLDFEHYIKSGFDVDYYLNTSYGTTIKDEAIAIPSYKIYRYIDSERDVRNIDFTSEPFQFFEKQSTIIKGETQVIVYYANANIDVYGNVTYSDPIVKETYSWLRNSLGFCYRKESIIEWYYEDETLGPNNKSTGRYLSQVEQIEEGKNRRRRIVSGLQIPVLGFMIKTMPLLIEDQVGLDSTWESNRQIRLIIMGRAFMALHKNSFTNFADDSNKQIITDMTNVNDSWFDNDISSITGVTGLTIRMYVLDQLDVGSL